MEKISVIEDLEVSISSSRPTFLFLWQQSNPTVSLDFCDRILDETQTAFNLILLPLGPYRNASSSDERFFVDWYHDGIRQPAWEDSTDVRLTTMDAWGDWRVDVRFWTREVRKDERGALRAHRAWTVRV